MAHSHAHGAEASWRPTRGVRLWLIGALIPFAIATIAGLVVLWPSHQHRPVPLQFTTYGGGKTVYETGRVIQANSKSCDTAAGSQVTAGSSAPSGGGVCSNAVVLIEHGIDKGHAIPVADSSGTIT